jgi:hypothetical protein
MAGNGCHVIDMAQQNVRRHGRISVQLTKSHSGRQQYKQDRGSKNTDSQRPFLFSSFVL